MNGRINTPRIESAGPADGKDNILRKNGLEHRAFGGCIQEDRTPADRSAVRAGRGQEFHCDSFFADFDSALVNFADERAAHVAGGVGTAAGGAALRVVVGLVADELSEFVMRERHAERGEMMKCKRRERGFDQRDIAVHRTAAHQILRKEMRGIGFRAVHAELVISLLVASGVDGGSHFESLRVDRDVLHAERVQPDRGGEPRRPAADDERVQSLHQKRSTVSPPSTLTTCPVE